MVYLDLSTRKDSGGKDKFRDKMKTTFANIIENVLIPCYN